MERYHGMKRVELLALAAEAGVKGRNRMTKAQLVENLLRLSRAVESPEEQVPSSVAPPGTGVWPAPPVQDRTPELPDLLGQSRLVLMPQGPKTAFAYWELAGDTPAGDLALRVISASTGTDMAVYGISGRTGSYYIILDSSGQEIEALLGHRSGGMFHQVLRSNRIRLPDDSPSEELPSLWMTRKKDFEEIHRLSMGESGTGIGEPGWTHEGYRRGHPLFSWPGERKKDLP